MDIGSHVLFINHQVILDRDAQRGVQHGAVFGGVDVLAGEHIRAAFFHASLLGQFNKRGVNLSVNEVLRQIHMKPGGVEGERGRPGGVGSKKLPQRYVLLRLKQLLKLRPCRLLRDIHD